MKGTTNEKRSPSYWNWYTAWLVANLVLLVICLPLLMGIGYARGWNTDLLTGKFEFKTVEDARRFWPEPTEYEENEDLDAQIPGRDFESAANTWYYWKYRPAGSNDVCIPGDFDPVSEPQRLSCDVPEATAGTRAFVWACYLVHQCLIWGITYKAQQEHRGNTQYHSGLRWYNVWSLIVNCGGYLLHLLQTHITYDATAQDVTEASSQGSVIMLLAMVLLMEYKHRGMILGWPSSPQKRWWYLPTPPMELIRKYHGYAFSWATIFTLWYHPMEPTVGHVLGFLHTGLLLIQQSLIFTPIHVNKYWRLLLEAWVTIHGGVVAIQTLSEGDWAPFLFGFLWMFCFTQIHGIPYYLGFVKVAEREKAKKVGGNTDEVTGDEAGAETTSSEEDDNEEPIPYEAYIPTAQWKRWLLRLVPVIVYFAMVVACYATVLKEPDQTSIGSAWIGEIVRIPSVMYLLALFTVAVAWGMLASRKLICCQNGYSRGEGAPVAAEDDEENAPAVVSEQPTATGKRISTATVLVVFCVCYALMVALAIVLEAIHVQTDLIALMIMCVVVFTVLSLVVMVVQEAEQDRVSLGPPVLKEEGGNAIGAKGKEEGQAEPSTAEIGPSSSWMENSPM